MNHKDDNETIFTKYTFYWIAKKENDKVYEILIELPNHCTVFEAIEKIIPYFNQEIGSNDGKLQLEPINYELYFCKKTGQPKSDYPALDDSQNLSQIGIRSFCIIEKANKSHTNSLRDSKKSEAAMQSSQKKSMTASQQMPGKTQVTETDVYSNDTSVNLKTKYCCFCIPVGTEEVKKEKGVSMQLDSDEAKQLTQGLLKKK